MAGGIWTSQNKIQPGTYINTLSQASTAVNVGDKGIVAIAEPLSWGPVGVIQTIIPGDDVIPYIGYDITSDKALFLREMMKGSTSVYGPAKILLYRPAGTGGAKAAATVGNLTATALYTGVRGNDITMVVSADPDAEDTFSVSTVIDGSVVDEQNAKTVADLVKNDWVEFSGTGDLTASAGEALIGGVDPTVATADYSKFLTALEPYRFDIVIYDGAEAVVKQSYAAFVKRLSNDVGRKCQAVMADAATCDSEWVISVGNGVKLSDGTVITAQQATWWLGGAEAGAKYNQSLTYARYPDAIEAEPKLTSSKVNAAIQAGQIVFIEEFDKVKVCTDINTLTSYTTTKQKEFSKNRVMRVLNQYCNDVYKECAENYIGGGMNNNKSGRDLFKGWIIGYLNELQANNGIKNFVADDVTVAEGNATDAITVTAYIQPVDSIEKIYMTVPVTRSCATTE